MSLVERLTTITQSWAELLIQPAFAHCDTEDGPAVQDGRLALKTGNINFALKWVHAEGEDEVRASFEAAGIDRSDHATLPGERQFLETLVRVHRAGEGAGFDGIKPTGTVLTPEVVAADAAMESGVIDPLRGLVPDERWAELETRFKAAQAKKGFDVDDLDAARDFVAAYVHFYKFAEGEDDHHHHGAHSH
ncbi:MAG TPA: DUF6448 family protein [Microthrixaceae bacterium]|nr:DUF6448 family protein [Microthrixaceae bacterium]